MVGSGAESVRVLWPAYGDIRSEKASYTYIYLSCMRVCACVCVCVRVYVYPCASERGKIERGEVFISFVCLCVLVL